MDSSYKRTLLSLCLLFSVVTWASADDFQIAKTDSGVEVTRNGKMMTRYLIKSGAKPILWPLIGPYGNEITRAYPMRDAGEHERNDHIHHRSFWFTHGNVNGIDFWSETKNHGNIIHRDFTKLQSGESAIIETKNDWIGPDGKRHCQDVRRLTFGSSKSGYWIDFDTTVTASDGQVVFGDTKEGSFGVRVAGSMKITAELGGTVLNANGDRDGTAWGKAAPWVDYVGPVNGKTVGITIMNHPSSFRYPTYWHVRTYGLFTANPFGLHHFKGNNDVDGSHTMAKGETMTLRYRVYIHQGTTEEANIEKQFSTYSNVKK
ncbi:MAG: PmoA family protein [Pseudomonadales bacterium]|nr:PmoA family protein [Pseudomonadales bacterium]